MELKSFSLNICEGDNQSWDVYMDFGEEKVSYRKTEESDPTNTNSNKLKENHLAKTEIQEFMKVLEDMDILFWENKQEKTEEFLLEWRLVMNYADATRIEFYGTNELPSNWQDLCQGITCVLKEPNFFR